MMRSLAIPVLPAMLALLFAVTADAREHDDRAYVTTPYGEVVTTRYGGCWRSPYPSETDQSEFAEQCGDVVDSDGDGVADPADACPGTAAGVPVDRVGCPRDSDGDGISDDRDRCPDTSAGVTVNPDGCERVGAIRIDLKNGEFEYDSAVLKPAMEQALDDTASSLKERGGLDRIVVIGYTDSTGSSEYNRELSRRRAQAVADYLAGQGIDPAMMSVTGLGETNPVDTNDTPEGRARNRRVIIVPR